MLSTGFPRVSVATMAITVSACGGGGEDRVAFTPPPPPSATSASNAQVKIFASPVPGQLASVGASVTGPGGNLDTYPTATSSFGTISTQDSDQAHIRYTSDGFYEVEMPGSAWDRLVAYKGLQDPGPDNNYFQPAGVAQNRGYVVTRNSRNTGYSYSELASWGSEAASRWGYVAIGTLTPSSGVPRTGSASYDGVLSGSVDIMSPDHLLGGYVPLAVDGTVALSFDFGGGKLNGAMTLMLPDGMNPHSVGTYAFKDTVFAAGDTTYSGKFDTAAAGQNYFLGQFTGPNAQETIGAWALPFVFTNGGQTIPADDRTHQAFGAWIAKRGN
jgi:hypothetical protein